MTTCHPSSTLVGCATGCKRGAASTVHNPPSCPCVTLVALCPGLLSERDCHLWRFENLLSLLGPPWDPPTRTCSRFGGIGPNGHVLKLSAIFNWALVQPVVAKKCVLVRFVDNPSLLCNQARRSASSQSRQSAPWPGEPCARRDCDAKKGFASFYLSGAKSPNLE